MANGTAETVECPLCGEQFDPSAAGGWCTNSDCGEWQYVDAQDESDGSEPTDDAGATADEADDASPDPLDPGDRSGDASTGPSAPADESADGPGHDGGDSAATGDDGGDPAATGDDGGDPSAATGDDATAGIGNSASEGAVEGGDDGIDASAATGEGDTSAEAAEGEDDATAEAAEGAGPEAVELACPECEATIEAEDSFCRSCGADVSHVEPGPSELTECPDCGTEVDPEDSFCRNCGEDLDVHRPASADDGATAGRTDEDGNAGTGQESAGEAAGADDAAGAGEVTLSVRNREIQMSDGETLGREIRSIIIETGGDEDDAVRIHREHVRFEYENGQFHLVDLGVNPTVVNGDRLEQGDRVPVSTGDRIELSDVAQLRVVDA
ncbi:hypothetical protein BRC92_04570 [Halobacteriales archaeon QS_4_69_31]|nr:MAG: hypothetical protein BRC92_04570 [Halobacteriales archaeon QS_4_69_31]